ncbi:MAG: histidine kinase [Bacteroidota bacterium]|nr:histidine kinase [Bacteroidota bacterium]
MIKVQQKKTSDLELRNNKLLSYFAEIDPDPVIRTDISGKIIFINPAAEQNGFGQFVGLNITKFFPTLNLTMSRFIEENGRMCFYGENLGRYFSIQIYGLCKLGFAQVYLHDVTELRERQLELERSQSEIKKFSAALQNKVEQERLRIARELHDNLGQKLVLIKTIIQKRRLKDISDIDLNVYDKLEQSVENALQDVRSATQKLKPDWYNEQGFLDSLEKLVKEIEKESLIKGSFGFSGNYEKFECELENSIFRIVQEALNNIVKHSEAKDFHVQLQRKSNSLLLCISDNGVGFNCNILNSNGGMGISNMKERAESHKGTFKISSSVEDGTIISAEFPLGE